MQASLSISEAVWLDSREGSLARSLWSLESTEITEIFFLV
jgi:hypothetical protein